MDSREQVKAEQRRGGLLSRLRPGESGPPSRIEPLLKLVRGYNPKADLKEIQRAYAVAEASHDGQKRMSGEDFIEHPIAVATILAELHLDTTTITAALLHDTVEDTDVTVDMIEEDFGDGGRSHRRRAHQARTDRVQDPRAGTGRERPQDGRGDGGRHPRPADQARRPPAQHADPVRAGTREAAPDRHRDAGDLRAARTSPGCPGDEVGARGPVVQDPASRAVPRDREPGGGPSQRAQGVDRRRDDRAARQDQGAGHQGRGRGPAEAPLLHLREDGDPRQGVQRDLRPGGCAHPGGQPPRHVRGARRGAFALASGPRPVQGLHRHAQVEHVPVAAHDGRRDRAASRSRSRSGRATCTGPRSSASPRTGATRRTASRRATPRTSRGWAR